MLGWAAECYPRLPDALPYKDVSRHHCLLSVNLPELRLLDLGSTNGTRLDPPADGDTAPAGEPGALTLSRHA